MKTPLLEDIMKLAGLRSLNEDNPVPPEDVTPIDFQNNTSWEGTRTELQQAFQGAADDYYKVTGKRVPVISAHRTTAYQKKLKDRWNSGDREGIEHEPADPGSSPHEKGFALDSPAAREMAKLGILDSHGLKHYGNHVTLVNNPDDVNPVNKALSAAPIEKTSTTAVQPAAKAAQQSTATTSSNPASEIPKSVSQPNVPHTPTPTPTPSVPTSTSTASTSGTDPLDSLVAANPRFKNNVNTIINPGDKITLPDGSSYTIAKNDNLWNISRGKIKGQVPVFPPAPPMPSTVSPDTEKPVSSTNAYPDDELKNMHDRILTGLGQVVSDKKDTPASGGEFPSVDTTQADAPLAVNQLPKDVPSTEVDPMGKPYPTGANDYQKNLINTLRKAGVDHDIDLNLLATGDEPTSQSSSDASTPHMEPADIKKGMDDFDKKWDADEKARQQAATPPQAGPGSANPEPSTLDWLKTLSGTAGDTISSAASSANDWMDTNVREPLVKAGIAPSSILPQKDESVELNSMRKLAGIKEEPAEPLMHPGQLKGTDQERSDYVNSVIRGTDSASKDTSDPSSEITNNIIKSPAPIAGQIDARTNQPLKIQAPDQHLKDNPSQTQLRTQINKDPVKYYGLKNPTGESVEINNLRRLAGLKGE
jgi:LAS superfamily LD-carboxypeptidase LdcB